MPSPKIRTLELGPRDGSLYLHGFHSTLAVRGSRVIATSEDTTSEVPLERLGRIFTFGNCTFSGGALEALMEGRIAVHHLSPAGRLRGVSSPESISNSVVRHAQWSLSTDTQGTIDIARRIVANKIMNQRVLLLRYRRRWRHFEEFTEVGNLRALRHSLTGRLGLDHIRGVEGAAARAYFSGLRRIIAPEWDFHGRNRRPPQDPVNSLLSFGYSMLLGEMRTAVAACGLDETIGFLHETSSGRSALALDLMEEFRPVIVDSLALSTINKSRLKKGHFVHSTQGADAEVRLTAEGRRTFFEEYERRMTTLSIHRPSGRTVTYREALLLQTRHFADFLCDQSADYMASGWA